jgi:hypothetical protein
MRCAGCVLIGALAAALGMSGLIGLMAGFFHLGVAIGTWLSLEAPRQFAPLFAVAMLFAVAGGTFGMLICWDTRK